jgi:hypothetical protein
MIGQARELERSQKERWEGDKRTKFAQDLTFILSFGHHDNICGNGGMEPHIPNLDTRYK